MPRQVVRRSNDDHVQIVGHAHRDHVAGDTVTETNTLRVVRLSRRTPKLSSSSRMVWLSEPVDSPSWAAALVKLPQSTTARRALSMAKRVSRIVESNKRVFVTSRD